MRLDFNLNLLKVFVKVAELGSYSLTSKVLKVPKSKVSRSITQLEEEIGTQLFRRTTRKTSLTEEGVDLYQMVGPKLEEITGKVENLGEKRDQISGGISLTAPFDFGEFYLPSIMAKFQQLHPKIEFNVHLSDAYIDLVSFNIDLGIRIGNLKDSNLKRKVIGYSNKLLVASPKYLEEYGVPQNIEELPMHQILTFANENQMDPLEFLYGGYNRRPILKSNSYPLLKNAALNSQGIGVVPSLLCQQELREGKLIHVLPEWSKKKSTVQIVSLPNKNEHNKIKLFKDFLVENLRGCW